MKDYFEIKILWAAKVEGGGGREEARHLLGRKIRLVQDFSMIIFNIRQRM